MTVQPASAASATAYSSNTNKQPPQSRDVVLAAAHELIRRNGFAGLSMRELARESGLAKATLYHHFEDKRDVIRSVIMQDLELLQRRISEAAAEPGDVDERLRKIIATYLSLQVERGMIVLQLLRESSIVEADLCDILRRYRHELVQPVMTVIQEAIDAGQARPVNVEHAVTSMFGMIHGFVTHYFLFEDLEIDEQVVDHIHALFLRGLMQQSPSTTPSSSPFDAASSRGTEHDQN